MNFWGTSVGRHLCSLWWRFISASLTKVVSGCLQQCLHLPCSLPSGSLNPRICQHFGLFTQMFFETKLEINFLWCWRIFFFPCFEKAFKNSNKYLKLYLVSSLRIPVNLSLSSVIKQLRLTSVSFVVAKIMKSNSEAFLTLQVWLNSFSWEGVWGLPVPFDRFPCQAYKLIFDCQPYSSYRVLW